MPECGRNAVLRVPDPEKWTMEMVGTMVVAQANRLATKSGVLTVCLAAGLAAAVLGAADRSDAAGLAFPAFSAHGDRDVVLAQAGPAPDKKADSQKPKKSKRRAVRCGGPGLPDCPM
jgi:hypothetical protein